MKERLLNVVKVFLIILGVLFLIQMLLIIGAIIGLVNFSNIDFENSPKVNFQAKEMQPVIKYVEEYKNENGVFPKDISNLKLKKGLEYKYEPSKDGNCYTIKINKDKQTKQYQRCLIQGENSNSTSESFVEYSD